MSGPEGPAPDPDIESFVTGSTYEIGEWRWLWRGNHEFPLRSHRGRWGRLVVWCKRLLRPLVRAPQADLWERQRQFNLVVLAHLEELYKLRDSFDALGRDLQAVQAEVLRDLRGIQADYIRDTGDLSARLEHVEEFLRDGLREVMQHHDALFARLDQKLDRVGRAIAAGPGDDRR